MYEYVITCQSCETQRSTHGLAEPVQMSDAEVLSAAGHTPGCAVLHSGTAKVQQQTRDGEPWLTLYTIGEA